MRNTKKFFNLIENTINLPCNIKKINDLIFISSTITAKNYKFKKIINTKSKEIIGLYLYYYDNYSENIVKFSKKEFSGLDIFVSELGIIIENETLKIMDRIDPFEFNFFLENINDFLSIEWMYFYPGSYIYYDEYQIVKVKSIRYDYFKKRLYAVLNNEISDNLFETII